MSGPHWACPRSRHGCFPGLHCSAPGCSAGELSEAGPGLCAPPRPKPLMFRFSGTPQRCRLSWACVLCPSQVQATQVTRCLVSAQSWAGQCVLLPPLPQTLGFLGAQREHHFRCAVCLLWGADLWLPPSWWMSTVHYPRKTWLATGSLLTVWQRMPSLGPRSPLSTQLWLSPACISASSGGWTCLQPASSPLVFAQCFVLWVGWQCLRLELFTDKLSLFFFLSLWLSHSLGCFFKLAPSDCSQGIQAQFLP